MTPEERIAAIKARLDAASAGPWEVDPDYANGRDLMIVAKNASLEGPLPRGCGFFPIVAEPSTRLDADFLAAAREDIPYLLSALRSSQEENARLREALVKIRKWHFAVEEVPFEALYCSPCSEVCDEPWPCQYERVIGAALGPVPASKEGE